MRTLHRLAFILISIASWAPATTGQNPAEKSICFFSAADALNNGTLLKRSPDEPTNQAIYEERRILLHTFHLFPTFFYIRGDGDSNAYATKEVFDDNVDGTVAFGVSLIRSEIRASGGLQNTLSIPAIMAHEFGHLLQFKFGTMATGAQSELQADFLAGWYLGNRAKGVQLTPTALGSVLRSFYEKGDYAFNSPLHHGKPEERSNAVKAGYTVAPLKLNDAYAASVAFVNPSKPNTGGPIKFVISDFEPVLDRIMSSRESGFAALKGNLSPGSKASWDANIQLPGSTECSVTWRNEVQGEYECVMTETLEVDIAINEWQKLVNEFKESRWETTIAKPSPKTVARKATVKSLEGQEFEVDLNDKTPSILGYRVTITISFDNY